MENTNNGGTILPMSLIHYIFDTYIGIDYKLLIHMVCILKVNFHKIMKIILKYLYLINMCLSSRIIIPTLYFPF